MPVTIAKNETASAASMAKPHLPGAETLSRWKPLWLALIVANLLVAGSALGSVGWPLSNDMIRPSIAIIALIAGFIKVVRTRSAIAPNRWGLVLFALLCGLSVYANLMCMVRPVWICAALLPPALFFALEGRSSALNWLKFSFLALFMINDLPQEIKSQVYIPLQYASCTVCVWLSHFVIPIHQTGHYFIVNGAKYDVAPCCAGLNMWACFIFTFALWQLFFRYRFGGYLLAMCLDPVLTLSLNCTRLFITALVAFYADQKTALAVHSNIEAFLLLPGLWILWTTGRRFRAD